MRRAIAVAARLVLGAVFIVAGVLKLGDPGAFAADIANYQLLPALAPTLAVVLPPLEIVIGLVLIVGPLPWRRAGALSAGALMLVFTGASVWALARGIDVACGCFGGASGTIGWTTILRDLALVAAAAVVLGAPERARAPAVA